MKKRGWTRLVEAIIAILIIASALIVLMQNPEKKKQEGEYILEIEKSILNELAANLDMRQKVAERNETAVKDFIRERIPLFLNFTARICNLTDPCSINVKIPQDREIYVSDVMVSGTFKNMSWSKVKIFAWRK